ncbi:MAG: hypothetical protein QM627_12025 [Luteolibacter sp.]
MKESPVNFELAEPVAPENLLPRFSLELWMLPAALAVLLAFIALFFIVRRLRRKQAAAPQNARQAAFHEATTGLTEITTDSPRQAAVLCSLILRKYLSIAASDPALFETHEEFVTRQESLASLDENVHAEAEQGFARLAALKYAPAETTDATPAGLVADSLRLLETLHHSLSA